MCVPLELSIMELIAVMSAKFIIVKLVRILICYHVKLAMLLILSVKMDINVSVLQDKLLFKEDVLHVQLIIVLIALYPLVLASPVNHPIF